MEKRKGCSVQHDAQNTEHDRQGEPPSESGDDKA